MKKYAVSAIGLLLFVSGYYQVRRQSDYTAAQEPDQRRLVFVSSRSAPAPLPSRPFLGLRLAKF